MDRQFVSRRVSGRRVSGRQFAARQFAARQVSRILAALARLPSAAALVPLARLAPAVSSLRSGGGGSAFALVAAVLVTALLSLLFRAFPGVDLDTSRLFYLHGVGFYLQADGGLQLLRHAGIVLVGVYCVLAGGLVVAGLLPWPRAPGLVRRGGFLLAVMALGPGLVVNLILKDNWGRARPRDVLQFGGSDPFSPAWDMVSYCHSNCSFVSGEASGAFALLALLFVVPKSWRLPLGVPMFALVTAVSANRVAFGGHFLSDTVLSWALVLVVMLVLERLLLRGRNLTAAPVRT